MNEIEQLEFNEQQKLNQETASIPWHQLQRFFASGHAIYVDPDLDLIQVAYQVSIDNTQQIQNWMRTKKIINVTDEQAKQWLHNHVHVWAVVVKPWILVQPMEKQ